MIEKLQFTNANNETLDFLTSWITPTRLIGFEGGEASHRRVESPLEDGSVYLNTRKLDMLPMIQFEIDGPDWATLQQRRRQVMEVLRPKAGLGVLAYQPDAAADEYQIEALVERRSGQDRAGAFSQIEVWTVQFRCPNPAWRISTAIETAVSDGGLATIDNDGDVATPPVLEMTAPALTRSPGIWNLTTGARLRLEDYSLASSDVLEIDMDAMTVEVNGSSVLASVTADSRFWKLAPGSNDLALSPGAVLPGMGANSGSGTAWSNTSNLTTDALTASVTLSGVGTITSQGLIARNYGFSVPGGATITGVRVIIRALQTTTSVRHVTVQLWDSSVIGDNKGGTASSDMFTVSLSTTRDKEFGGPSDLWGATLTPAIVNGSAFGVALQMQRLSGGSTTTTHIGSMYLEVFYDDGGTPGSVWDVVHYTELDGV